MSLQPKARGILDLVAGPVPHGQSWFLSSAYPFHWAHSGVDFLPLTCVGQVQLSHCTEMTNTVLDKSLSLSPSVIIFHYTYNREVLCKMLRMQNMNCGPCSWEARNLVREEGCLCVPAAAAAKSLQSCPTLCNPRDGSPPGSPVPGVHTYGKTIICIIHTSYQMSWKDNKGYRNSDGLKVTSGQRHLQTLSCHRASGGQAKVLGYVGEIVWEDRAQVTVRGPWGLWPKGNLAPQMDQTEYSWHWTFY